MEFASKDDAKIWMIDNQKGRRNLTDGWKWELAQAKKKILERTVLVIRLRKLSFIRKEIFFVFDKTLHRRLAPTRRLCNFFLSRARESSPREQGQTFYQMLIRS